MVAEIFFYAALVIAAVVYWVLWTQPFGSGWLPMPASAIRRAVEKAKIGRKDVVFDLGCGDGRVLVECSKHSKWAVGFEIDPIRFLVASLRLKGKANAKVLFGNFFKKPLDEADVLFAYLHPKANRRLAAKLKRECRPGTRVVSYWWPMPGLKEAWRDEKGRLYIYRI